MECIHRLTSSVLIVLLLNTSLANGALGPIDKPNQDDLEYAAFVLEGEVLDISRYKEAEIFSHRYGTSKAYVAKISIHNIRPGSKNRDNNYWGYVTSNPKLANISSWDYVEIQFLRPEYDPCHENNRHLYVCTDADFSVGEIVRVYLAPFNYQRLDNRYFYVAYEAAGKITLKKPPIHWRIKEKWPCILAIALILAVTIGLFYVFKIKHKNSKKQQ